MKKTSLITGSGGFVGKHLIPLLLEKEERVIATDRLMPPQLPSGALGAVLDVCDYDSCFEVLQRERPDTVYYLAGLAFIPQAEEHFEKALLVHVAGVHNILRAVWLLELPTRVLFVSSGEVYGRVEEHELPLSEENAIRPMNNYSLSKRMGELVIERYRSLVKREPLVLRPFNHIGSGQNELFVVSSFARQLAEIAHGIQPPTIKVGNLLAERDFTDVRDVLRGYILAAESGTGIYNFCSGIPRSIQSILDELLEISGLEVFVESDPARMRPSDRPRVIGSSEKAKRELGWEPVIPFRDTLEWVYRDWYDSLGTGANG